MQGIVLSDPHCGSHYGLTPPEYWYDSTNPRTRIGKLGKLQRQTWELFAGMLLKNYHFALWIGDMIDGPSPKQKGSEHITTDIEEQCTIASEVVKHVGAKYNYMVRGTAYHVGNSFDAENWIVDKCREVGNEFQIENTQFKNINGRVFDLKHHTTKTGIPHGVSTGPKKAHVHNLLWHIQSMQPVADVTIRGHVHEYCMTQNPYWTGITCPALQCLGCRYARRLDSQVHFGFLDLAVSKEGAISWGVKIKPLLHQAQKATKIPSS